MVGRMTAAAAPHGLAAVARARVTRRVRARRRSLAWWLVYGPVRSGTTFMMQSIAASARLQVGDWGLRPALGLPPDLPHIHFDRARARADVSRNVLRTATLGGGRALDLVFKCAQLRLDEHAALVEMWGVPERTIFCLREPSGYLASAVRKFPDVPIEAFRVEYLRDLEVFGELGGDLFDYTPDLTTGDYRRFLAPLPLATSARFAYRGATADDLVTSEMVVAYDAVRAAPASSRSVRT